MNFIIIKLTNIFVKLCQLGQKFKNILDNYLEISAYHDRGHDLFKGKVNLKSLP
jgi:hypothetical protein